MTYDALPVPLLGGIGDWIIPAIVVIIWVISQVVGGAKRPQRIPRPQRQVNPGGPARRPGAGQVGAGGGQVGAGGGQVGAGGMADEIESFLRNVQKAGAAPEAQRVPRNPPPAASYRPSMPSTARTSEIVEAELVEPIEERAPRRLVPRATTSMPQSAVGARAGARAAAEQPSHLASKVELADDMMQDHVHDVFDHDVGSLHDTSDAIHEADLNQETSVQIAKVPASVQAIRDMLASPESARKAIILSEILSRRGAP